MTTTTISVWPRFPSVMTKILPNPNPCQNRGKLLKTTFFHILYKRFPQFWGWGMNITTRKTQIFTDIRKQKRSCVLICNINAFKCFFYQGNQLFEQVCRVPVHRPVHGALERVVRKYFVYEDSHIFTIFVRVLSYIQIIIIIIIQTFIKSPYW